MKVISAAVGTRAARGGKLSFFLLSISFISCTTPHERFWKWFKQHDTALSSVKTGKEEICDQLHNELRKVQNGLVFEFGPIAGGQREFVVSADGSRDLFPIVEQLVSAAPHLQHWRIIAFRQRRLLDFGLQVGGSKLRADDVRMQVRANDNRIDVTLFVGGLTPANNDVMSRAVLLLLDSALGEYDVETRIGGIEVKPLAAAPIDALSFRELPDLVDALKH